MSSHTGSCGGYLRLLNLLKGLDRLSRARDRDIGGVFSAGAHLSPRPCARALSILALPSDPGAISAAEDVQFAADPNPRARRHHADAADVHVSGGAGGFLAGEWTRGDGAGGATLNAALAVNSGAKPLGPDGYLSEPARLCSRRVAAGR